jgi:hypothetical protein
MNKADPQAILNREISLTNLAVVASSAASLFSLCLFFFLIDHHIVKKILGTSAIGFVVFGVIGISKFRDLITLRRLRAELFAQEAADPRWIRLSCRQKKETLAIGRGIGVPADATSVTIEFDMGIGAQVSHKLATKFAARFLPALFTQRPHWLALLRP